MHRGKCVLAIVLLLCSSMTCAPSDGLEALIGTWQVKAATSKGDKTEFRLTVRDEDGGASMYARINPEGSNEDPMPGGCYTKYEGGVLSASASGDQVQAKTEKLESFVGDCKELGLETGVEQAFTTGDLTGKRTKGDDGFNGTWEVELFDWSCSTTTSEGYCTKYTRKQEVEERCTVEIRSLVDADISVKCDDWEKDCGEARVDGSLDGDHFSATVTITGCNGQDDYSVKITADRQ